MDESRKSFEQWASKQFNISVEEIVNKRMLGDYLHNQDLHNAWQAWIDSREAIEIELPKPHAHLIWIQAGHAPDDYWDDVAVSYSEKDKCCDGSDRYPVHAGWEIEEVLRAAGIKVKE
ncbi:TPA: hypothetical protein ACQ80C_001309 [Escherichia coli]